MFEAANTREANAEVELEEAIRAHLSPQHQNLGQEETPLSQTLSR